jgi:hypothetical protein
MAKAMGTSNSFGKFLDDEKQRFLGADDSYVFHEFLEGCNSPEYFSNVVARANSHALSYVADAEFASHFATGLEPQARSHLDSIVDSTIREQFLDYFVSRTFRHNILALKHARPVTELDADALKDLWFSGSFRCDSEPVLVSMGPSHFVASSGVTISAIFPIAKAACVALDSVWPRARPGTAGRIPERIVSLWCHRTVQRAVAHGGGSERATDGVRLVQA